MEIRLVVGERFCIGIMLFLLQQRMVTGGTCVPAIPTNGFFLDPNPRGGIVLKAGSDLVIDCTLNPDQGLHNSSHLFWKFAGRDENGTSVSVLNDLTAQLLIPNVPKSTFMAFCSWKNDSRTTLEICHTKVYVLDLPAENVPINCTSYDFNNVTCQWKLPSPDDILPTNWSFKQKINKSFKNCSWRVSNSVGPSLQGNFCVSRSPCFALTGTNKLGRGVSWYSFDLYRNVVLSAPIRLQCTEVTGRTAVISWDDNSAYKSCAQSLIDIAQLRASIDYRIIVKKENAKKTFYEMITTNTTHALSNLTPFMKYTVEIQCRFVIAGHCNSWSEGSSIEFQTDPSVPATSPRNLIGQISRDSSQMNATLYWTGMSKKEQFGKKFRYTVTISSNTSKTLVNTTTKTYFRWSNLPTDLLYSFQVHAENEMGMSEEASHFYIRENDLDESSDLAVEDVILQDNTSSLWNYSLSWSVANNKIYNVALYWCSGRKSDDGLIHCDDNGIHLQQTVSSKDVNYKFIVPNPIIQEHHFGIAAIHPTQSRRILWSSCIISSKRKPLSPQFNPLSVGPDWVYLSWHHLKCEQKAAYITGYKIYVIEDDQVSATFFMKAEVVAYNITELHPNTEYTFGISTKTLFDESDMQTISVPTSMSSTNTDAHQSDPSSLMGIIIPTIVSASFLCCIVAYVLYKRFRLSIHKLKNIQLPPGLTEEYHKDTFISSNCNCKKTKIRSRPPLRKLKESWQTSRSWYGFSRTRYCSNKSDAVPAISSPTGSSIYADISPPDSGIVIESPILDSVKPVFEFGNLATQDTSIVPPSGYSKAIVVLDYASLPKLVAKNYSRKDINSDYEDYSRVGSFVSSTTNSVLPSAVAEPFEFHTQTSNYVQIGMSSLPEMSTDTKEIRYPQKCKIPVHANSLEHQSCNAQVETSGLEEVDKHDSVIMDKQKLKVTNGANVGYTQMPTSA